MTWEPPLDYRFYLVLVIALAALLGLAVRYCRATAGPECLADPASRPDPEYARPDPAQPCSDRQSGTPGTSPDRDLLAGQLPEHEPRGAGLALGSGRATDPAGPCPLERRSRSSDPVLSLWEPPHGHGGHRERDRARSPRERDATRLGPGGAAVPIRGGRAFWCLPLLRWPFDRARELGPSRRVLPEARCADPRDPPGR